MDDVTKYRLTGALIWLTLLVIVVPSWYSNPVNFKHEGYQNDLLKAERPLVENVYELPMANDNRQKTAVVTPQPTRVDDSTEISEQQSPERYQIKQDVANATDDSSKKTNKSAPTWIVRVIAYADIRDANNLLGRLETEYNVSIKAFEKSGTFSVRTGPYNSRAKAEQDQRKLDKMLHTKSEVVQLN